MLGSNEWTRLITAASTAHKALNRPTFGKDEPIALWAWFYLPRPPSLSKRILYPVHGTSVDNLGRLVGGIIGSTGLIADVANIIDYFPRKRFADGFAPHSTLIIDRFEVAEQDERGAA